MLTTDESVQIITRLTALADVLTAVDAVKPVAPRDVAPRDAVGRVLAADVVLPADMPAAPVAVRDGFALTSDLTHDASPYAPVALPVMPARIDAGDPVPPDADAVAPFDAVTIRHGRAEVLAPVASGEGVLPRGGDAAAGHILRRAGTRVRQSDAAVFAAIGVARVGIHKPRLRLVVARPDPALDVILAMVENDIGRFGNALSDNAMPLDRELRDENCDALIVVGGTGSGRKDNSVQTLARIGEVTFHGIGLSPGETAALGRAGTRPVLMLPGRLDAACAVWQVIGRRLLHRLAGFSEPEPSITGALSRKITSTVGVADFIPVALSGDRVEPLASKVLPLAALARAAGFVLVPPESEGYPAGTSVTVSPWA
jgi:molybdopterin biosynthesis enzyme